MFLPTVHSVTSLRQPYFAGKGDQERPADDNLTGSASQAGNPADDKGDTWRPRRGTVSSDHSTASALTQMIKGLLPGQASEAPKAEQALEAPVESDYRAPKSVSSSKGNTHSTHEQQAGAQASSSEQGKSALPKRMQALLGTSKTPAPVLYKQNILGTSVEGRQRRFSDVAQETSGRQIAAETDLPIRSHFSTSPNTSLMVDVSETRSVALSRQPAFSVGRSRSVSDDAGGSLSGSSNSEGSSGWLVDDDSDVLAEREARKALARSQKGTDKASSAAQSDILEESEDDDGDSHSLEGDSQLDDDDYFLYHDDDGGAEGSDAEGKSFISAAPSRAMDIGESSSHAIRQPKDCFSESLRVKSQDEIQASMNNPKESMLSRLLQSPEDRKFSDLVLSYRQNIEQEKAILNKTLSQQQIKREKEAIIQLCNRFTLEELENGQKNFMEGLRRNDRRLEDLAQRVGIPQGVSLPEALHRHQEKLKARQIELTVQLEQLPHPGLGAKVSAAHVRKERDSLNQTREEALNEESQVESALQRYESLQMDAERLQLKLSHTNQAIFLKKRRDMVKQLNECPPDRESQIELWNELARNYALDELGAMMNFLNRKRAPEVQLGILKKAIDIKTTK